MKELINALDISTVSVIWKYVTDGVGGVAKYLAQAIMRLLKRVPLGELKTYTEAIKKLAKFIIAVTDIFIVNPDSRKAGRLTGETIDAIACHAEDGDYTDEELDQDADNLALVVEAWKNTPDRKSRITTIIAMIVAATLGALLIYFGSGCSTLVAVDLKDSSGVNVGSISLQDSSWPIVSYFTGPTYRFRVYEDFGGSVWLEGNAALTNSTSAVGIYESSESKNLEIKMGFNTNAVEKVKNTP